MGLRLSSNHDSELGCCDFLSGYNKQPECQGKPAIVLAYFQETDSGFGSGHGVCLQSSGGQK